MLGIWLSTSYHFNCFWLNGACKIHALVRWCLPPMSRNCSFKQFSSARLYFNQSKSCYAFHFDSYPHSVVLLLSSWFYFMSQRFFFHGHMHRSIHAMNALISYAPFPFLLTHLYYMYVFCGLCLPYALQRFLVGEFSSGHGKEEGSKNVRWVRWEGFVVALLDSTSSWGGQNCRSFYRVLS